MAQHTPEQLLQSQGLRVTSQRVIVLTAMMGEPNDCTAQSLHERLRPDHPSLGLTTVYRTLNALADGGVVDRLHHGDSTCFRYCAPGHHHHLTCSKCHTIVELRDCDLAQWAEQQGARHGFSQVTHAVELEGICARCAA